MKRVASALLLLAASATAGAAEPDDRQPLLVSAKQRDHVLGEMRGLLSGIQAIVAALSKDDMAAVAGAARSLGMGMAHKAEGELKGALPKEFMALGMSLHQDFDRIAESASAKRDPKELLRQMSEAMNKCNACHEGYQIRVRP